MNKSISQIAEDLQVTRQTIYNKLKGTALSAAVKPYTVQQGKYTLYDEQAQDLIKQAICGNSANSDLTACKREFDKVSSDLTECKKELDKLSKELENRSNKILELNAEIDVLKAESETVKGELTKCKGLLSDRDKQLDELRADKQKLNERLDKAESERASFLNNISELTIALKAAQALHGMDKQQTVIELKEPAAAEQSGAAQEPQKKSLLYKLFHRKG